MNLSIATPCAIAGAFLAGMMHFFFGRKGGRARIEKKSKWKAKTDELEARLEQSLFLVLLGIRFMYGFRVLAPIIVGMSVKRFSLYSITTILIWTTVYVGLGLAFGELIQKYLVEIQHVEKYIIAGLATVAIVIYFISKKTIIKSPEAICQAHPPP